MLATFLLRLALGMLASLLLVLAADHAGRFCRVVFLVVLGLLTGAVVLLWPTASAAVLLLAAFGIILSYLGSIVSMLERILLVRWTAVLAVATVVALALPWPGPAGVPLPTLLWQLGEELTSGAVVGMATSAMLLGHSYLVAPGMPIAPFHRLLAGLFAALLLRLGFFAVLLMRSHLSVPATDGEWLVAVVRVGAGLIGPLVLGRMAWQCARIHSTQSATGILYAVVILCFIGELTGMSDYP
jgi:hypothetical protein